MVLCFDLRIYVCSRCTQVHNSFDDCLQHETKRHPEEDNRRISTNVVLNFGKSDIHPVEPEHGPQETVHVSPVHSSAIATNHPVAIPVATSTTEMTCPIATPIPPHSDLTHGKREGRTTSSSTIDVDDRILFNHPYTERISQSKTHLQCSFCDRLFLTRECLKQHERYHTGERPFPCRFPPCQLRFVQYGSRIDHERSIHKPDVNIKELVRDPTPISAPISDDDTPKFIQNQRSTPFRKFACAFCCKRFLSNAHLRRHEKIHTHIRPDGLRIANSSKASLQSKASE